MNTYVLNIVKPSILNVIKNISEDDLRIMMGKFYIKDALEYFTSLGTKDLPLRFVEGFPLQSTQLPAYSFILGNDDSSLAEQSFSFENEEISDTMYTKLQSLLYKIDPEATSMDIKCWLHKSSIIIGVHAMNKIEVTWLCLILDYVLKALRDKFQLHGILDFSFNFTDLRVTSELFKLQSATRVCQVSFRYQKFVPVISSVKSNPENIDNININYKL